MFRTNTNKQQQLQGKSTPYLHESAFLQELPPGGQYARDTLSRQTVLDCQHLLEVIMLANVFIDVRGYSSNLGRSSCSSVD